MNERPAIWWLPDALTLSRVPMGAMTWALVKWPSAFVALMVVAAMTDLLDGVVARRLKVEGRGVWLDPLCDKLFILSAAAALVCVRQPQWWHVLLVAARETLQLPLVATLLLLGHGRRYNFKAGLFGKATTFAQFLALCALLFEWALAPWAWLAAVLGVLAVGEYVWRGVTMVRE